MNPNEVEKMIDKTAELLGKMAGKIEANEKKIKEMEEQFHAEMQELREAFYGKELEAMNAAN